MSLHNIASHLATAGRGDDSVLVHMTPKEVQGLQSLAQQHGGSLTTNPHTGLPEAGFLSSILPTIAGIGLSIASGGALSPLMTAGIVGGLGALATGDIGKGLMAGMGAYGGAGLGTAMAAPAATAPDLFSTVQSNAAQAAMNTPAQSITSGLPEIGGANLYSQVPSANLMTNPAVTSGMPEVGGSNLYGQGIANTNAVMPEASSMSPSPIEYPSQVASTQAAPQGSPDYWGNAKNWADAHRWQAAGMLAGPLLAMSEQKPVTQDTAQHGDRYSYDKANQNYNPNGPQYFNFQYGAPTVTHYAQGGDVRYPQSQVPSNSYSPAQPAPVPEEVIGAQDTAVDPYTGQEKFARGGGISQLLSGAGDGVSDSIPATINGKHPARLADGEFVLPARIVSEIGNGSTGAGAKKLYAMMGKIQAGRKKSMGKDGVAKDTNAERHLPA